MLLLAALAVAIRPALRASATPRRCSLASILCRSGGGGGLLTLFVLSATRPSSVAELALRAGGVSGFIVTNEAETRRFGGADALPVLWSEAVGDETVLVLPTEGGEVCSKEASKLFFIALLLCA